MSSPSTSSSALSPPSPSFALWLRNVLGKLTHHETVAQLLGALLTSFALYCLMQRMMQPRSTANMDVVNAALQKMREKHDASFPSSKSKLSQFLQPLYTLWSSYFPSSQFSLNKHEMAALQHCVFPEHIGVTFDDIGGLQQTKLDVMESVIFPLTNCHLINSALWRPPTGVLLYGPSGTGKTMFAKALAKSCGATFLNVSASTLQEKWFGETNKNVRALFDVARRFAPTIIFIDEIDLLLRKRNSDEHEATAVMKGEFMVQWDGLLSGASNNNSNSGSGSGSNNSRGKVPAPVVVLGATNRPFDIDDAFLRRLPRAFLFDLPNKQERVDILKTIMRHESFELSDRDYDALANMTENYSGSDLKQLCIQAANQPLRMLAKQYALQQVNAQQLESKHDASSSAAAADDDANNNKPFRESMESSSLSSSSCALPAPQLNVTLQHFEQALAIVRPTGHTSLAYMKQFQQRHANQNR